MRHFIPVIDLEATGKNIIRLRTERNLTVRDLQHYFGFAEPNAIYHWQQGKCLPAVENLYALSVLFRVSMNEILVEQQAAACCPFILRQKTRVVIEAVMQWRKTCDMSRCML